MASKKSQNIFINKTLLTQLAFIAVIAVGILIFEQSSDKSLKLGDKGSGEATLLIDFENVRRKFQGEVVEKMTVLDAVNAAVAAGEIKLIYSVDRENNTRVVEINDHLLDGGRQFAFFVNSKKLGSNELNKTYLKPGDEIVIKLE